MPLDAHFVSKNSRRVVRKKGGLGQFRKEGKLTNGRRIISY